MKEDGGVGLSLKDGEVLGHKEREPHPTGLSWPGKEPVKKNEVTSSQGKLTDRSGAVIKRE